MPLSIEEQLILASVKITPSKQELEALDALIPLVDDWELTTSLLIERGIAPLLYKKLPLLSAREGIPELTRNKLQQAYFRTLTRTMVLYNAYYEIARAFSEQHVRLVALKGIYLSESLYHDIGLRQLSDIDLLISEKDGEQSLEILRQLGYVSLDNHNVSDFIESKSQRVHYTPMVRNEISVELHTKLHRVSETYHVSPESCMANSLPFSVQGTQAYGLNEYDLLIHLCVHLDKHFREGHVQFTCFMDISNLLEHYTDSFQWEVFLARCREFNCEAAVMKYLIMVHRFFNVTLSEEFIDAYSHLLTPSDEELFCKYLRGYTFEDEVKTAVPTHIENLKNLNTISDVLTYLGHLLFPSKKFMVEKYGLAGSPVKRDVEILHNQSVVGKKQHGVSSEKTGNYQLSTTNYKLRFWWLWYPYRYAMGVKGLFYMLKKKKN